MISIKDFENALYSKINYVTGNYLCTREDYDSQLSEIKKNFMFAFEKSKTILELNEPEWINENQRISLLTPKNEVFIKYYKRTNSPLENEFKTKFKQQAFPINLYHWIASDRYNEMMINVKQGYYLDLVKNVLKYIEAENLSEIESFYINLNENTSLNKICNTENSLPNSKYNPLLIVYLFSKKRIIKLVVDDKHLISSKENIIQKDLKKIEIRDDVNIYFHYHGLHQPDKLVIDDYKSAINLRRQLSDLRQRRVNYNKRR
jgi:hypothetical protein